MRPRFALARLPKLQGAWLLAAMSLTASFACESKKESKESKDAPHAASKGGHDTNKPKRLYLPSDTEDPNTFDLGAGEGQVADSVTFGPSGAPLAAPSTGRCPPEMVHVAGAFCIDRFEVSLVDAKSGRQLSPHYPPDKGRTSMIFERWTRRAPQSRMSLGRNTPVPEPPAFQLTENFAPRATSLRGQLPAGYLSRGLADSACKNAGKRLCSRDEWVRACRGERGTKYPYGGEYKVGMCNVFRESHPASLLHGNASKHHLDPRLGLTQDEEGPLLRPTGSTSECVSRWGNDAVYDMVGNLDEWIEDPGGAFVGGFYSRATMAGCDATIDSHDPGYLDYSLGTRCCLDPP